MSVGWSHTVLDVHAFRQSQSLIPVEYMLTGGHWLRYQTPVLGPPWTVPFEFPLYQWIVASIVAASGMPVVQSGRLVSVLFLFLSLVPLFAIQSYLGVNRSRRLLVPSLLL